MTEKILEFLPELLKGGIIALAGYFFGEWKNDEDACILKKLMNRLGTPAPDNMFNQ